MSHKDVREFVSRESEILLIPGADIAQKEWKKAFVAGDDFRRRMYRAWFRYFSDLSFLDAVVNDASHGRLKDNLAAENTALQAAIDAIEVPQSGLEKKVLESLKRTLELERNGNTIIIENL